MPKDRQGVRSLRATVSYDTDDHWSIQLALDDSPWSTLFSTTCEFNNEKDMKTAMKYMFKKIMTHVDKSERNIVVVVPGDEASDEVLGD